jgi:hypothetical protein
MMTAPHLMARTLVIAQGITGSLGRTVIVENRGGGNHLPVEP